MRKFYLLRHEDVNGYSGTGVVAEGVIFNDGTGAFTWLTPIKTVTTFWKMSDIRKMHGHGGKTEVIIEGKRKFNECAAAAHELKMKQRLERRKLEKENDDE